MVISHRCLLETNQSEIRVDSVTSGMKKRFLLCKELNLMTLIPCISAVWCGAWLCRPGMDRRSLSEAEAEAEAEGKKASAFSRRPKQKQKALKSFPVAF